MLPSFVPSWWSFGSQGPRALLVRSALTGTMAHRTKVAEGRREFLGLISSLELRKQVAESRPAKNYRGDGSYKPAKARSRVIYFVRSLGYLNTSDFSRQDTDNFETALSTIHRILERQNRRKAESIDADQTSPG